MNLEGLKWRTNILVSVSTTNTTCDSSQWGNGSPCYKGEPREKQNPNATQRTSLLDLKDSCTHTLCASMSCVQSSSYLEKWGEIEIKGRKGGTQGRRGTVYLCLFFVLYFFFYHIQGGYVWLPLSILWFACLFVTRIYSKKCWIHFHKTWWTDGPKKDSFIYILRERKKLTVSSILQGRFFFKLWFLINLPFLVCW